MSDADNSARSRRAAVESSRKSREFGELSEIQRAIMHYLRLGNTTKEIAAELRVSERTVKLHVRHSLRLIRARNRDELLARIKVLH